MAAEPQQATINLFDGPIAGQSMTASPESKMKWDGPPKYNNVQEATQEIFLKLLEENTLRSIVDLLYDGQTVSDITQVVLMQGYAEGEYNPDMLMMLIEPVMYMIMAIGDKFGIGNVKIYTGEENDYNEYEDEDVSSDELESTKVESLKDLFGGRQVSPEIRRTMENSPVAKQLENIDVESIMAKPKPQETSPDSLMGRSE